MQQDFSVFNIRITGSFKNQNNWKPSQKLLNFKLKAAKLLLFRLEPWKDFLNLYWKAQELLIDLIDLCFLLLTRASATAASTSVPVFRTLMAFTDAEILAWWIKLYRSKRKIQKSQFAKSKNFRSTPKSESLRIKVDLKCGQKVLN